jgi:di/tricarboxylate transporter
MTFEQVLLLGILAAAIAMFFWGRWRHDMVAVGALLACVLGGLVSTDIAFSGFAHPAVITVACVLVLSQGLQNSGAINALTHALLPAKAGPTVTIAVLTALGAVLSAFMNNVGALALLMPLAIQVATRLNLPPGRALMPLAFGSILGGMTTLIGTPPNLIVSGFRAQTGAGSFGMFDFSPVGVVVAAAGVLFIVLIGWHLVPGRRNAASEKFDTGAYMTEARVPEGAKAASKTLREIEEVLDKADAQVVGLVRNEVRVIAPSPGRVVRAGDILVIEAEVGALADVLARLGLHLEEAKKKESKKDGERSADEGEAPKPSSAAASDGKKEKDENKPAPSDEVVLAELAVLPQSPVVGRSASDMFLSSRYGINLLAVSRQGRRSMARLRTISLAAGDVLLMQGSPEAISEFAANWRCVPLAERALRIPDKTKAAAAGGIMAAAVGGAAFGLLPAAISFAGGVLASLALRTVPPRAAYDAIDWPVIVLLAALLPVAGAMQSTGAADLIARVLLDEVAQGNAVIGLAVILVTTMLLTDVMNNAATAAVMCPIAIGAADRLAVNPDTFLMAVAIGASCAFLTPIGHQNNTLILGPGGFRFTDYWKMGLPLDLLVVAVAIPMLLFVWPL